MATIRVHTTQNVTLEYEVASIGDRIVATLIDYLVLMAWGALMAGLVYAIGRGASGTSKPLNYHNVEDVIALLVMVLMVVVVLGPIVFYSLLSEVFFNGQSIGKKARNLRVVRLNGTAPSLGDYFLRWLLRLVDMGFGYGLIAVITIALNGKGQRLGDLAAGTSVISLKPVPSLLPEVPIAEDYQPVFAQAANLTDYDVALLRQLLARSLRHDNYVLLNETATKIKHLLLIQSDLPDEVFLRTILHDHAHLLAKG